MEKSKEPIGKGKTAIITGGSRGIGESLVLKLGELGYNVVINYRSDSSKVLSETLAKKVEEKYGVKTLIVKADVSKYENCEEIVKQTINKFGDKIHVLVNNYLLFNLFMGNENETNYNNDPYIQQSQINNNQINNLYV